MVTIGVFDPPQQGKGAEALGEFSDTKDLCHLNLKEVFDEV